MITKKAASVTGSAVNGFNSRGIKEKRKENSDDIKKLEGDISRKTSLAKERANNTVMLGFEKAVAHYENQSMYPIPADNQTVEKAFYDFLAVLPNSKRKKMVEKINETLKASPTARANKYKDIVSVNFKSSVSIAEQVKTMAVPDELRFTEEEANLMTEEFNSNAEKSKNTGYATTSKPQPQQAASASKISFFVDNMTCLNPDDAIKDEVNLAGFSVDSSGNNVQLSPLFVGKFRKNETVLLAGKEKLFTLNIDPNQIAQSFTAGLFIIESDLIQNQDVVEKLITLSISIGLAVILVTGVLIAVSILAAPVITPLTAMLFVLISLTFDIIGLQVIPLMGDDISIAVTDTLAIADKVDIGETFPRVLTIGKGFDARSTFDGKYTAAARWVGEA